MAETLPTTTDEDGACLAEGMVEVKSEGWYPLRYLDPKNPHFFDDASELARAVIDIGTGPQPCFCDSARGLMTALIRLCEADEKGTHSHNPDNEAAS